MDTSSPGKQQTDAIGPQTQVKLVIVLRHIYQQSEDRGEELLIRKYNLVYLVSKAGRKTSHCLFTETCFLVGGGGGAVHQSLLVH